MGLLPARQTGPWATATVVFALGFGVSLAGDATHVASGTTRYGWAGMPEIWSSAIWFPFLVGGSVLAGSWLAGRLAPSPARSRGRADSVLAAALVLGLYALTSALRGEPETVSVVLVGALAVAIWLWWDPSPGALAGGLVAAVIGPVAEIVIVEIGAASYAADADGLAGVAPWLPCLYFAAGAVATRLWGAISRDGR